MGLKQLRQSFLFNGLVALLLFVPAGTLAWPEAWIFLGIFAGCGLATGVWLSRVDPDLLAERMKSPLRAGQRRRDRVIIAVMMGAMAGWLVFMALDARRFAWSDVPFWAQVLGAAMIVVAFVGWAAVLRANRFAVTTVRLQEERGQTVISSGPYAVVRHPMYAFALFLLVGTPLLLGSFWGLLGLAFFVPLLALRALGEEALLMDGLAGYRDYAARVRYRLLPGLW